VKYYDDEVMRGLRLALEQEVLRWPGVTTRKMFGCPCYMVKGNLFAFLVTHGLVLPRTADETGNLQSLHGAKPFRAGNKTSRRRLEVPIRSETELRRLIPFVRDSFELSLHSPAR